MQGALVCGAVRAGARRPAPVTTECRECFRITKKGTLAPFLDILSNMPNVVFIAYVSLEAVELVSDILRTVAGEEPRGDAGLGHQVLPSVAAW